MPTQPAFYLARLEGSASVLKGERNYIHGSDIISELDIMTVELGPGWALTSTEFHQPLFQIGILEVHTSPQPFKKDNVCATGSFSHPEKGLLHYYIYPSPVEVSLGHREFNENELVSPALLDIQSQSIALAYNSNFTFPEHLTSCMKRLCSSILPDFERWWFVRLTKSSHLPTHPDTLEIRVRRITAGRFISAKIAFNGQNWGGIDFMGEVP